MSDCAHDCVYCVTEAKCKEGHLAALGVCDRHINVHLDAALVAAVPEDAVVGVVMRMTGGRANPSRVEALRKTATARQTETA